MAGAIEELIGGASPNPGLRDRVQARYMQGIGPEIPDRFLFLSHEFTQRIADRQRAFVELSDARCRIPPEQSSD